MIYESERDEPIQVAAVNAIKEDCTKFVHNNGKIYRIKIELVHVESISPLPKAVEAEEEFPREDEE